MAVRTGLGLPAKNFRRQPKPTVVLGFADSRFATPTWIKWTVHEPSRPFGSVRTSGVAKFFSSQVSASTEHPWRPHRLQMPTDCSGSLVWPPEFTSRYAWREPPIRSAGCYLSHLFRLVYTAGIVNLQVHLQGCSRFGITLYEHLF
jgi:hypothetical protein